MLNDSLYSSDRMDWPTPQYLFDALHEEFDFTLDPCAREDNAKCELFFDETVDGLSQKWTGRVFMNPPYGRAVAKWVAKAKAEVEAGNAELVVCLVPVRSDAKWWHASCMKASEIRLMDQRLEFQGANNKAPFPTALVIFRRNDHSDIPTKLASFEVRPLRVKYASA